MRAGYLIGGAAIFAASISLASAQDLPVYVERNAPPIDPTSEFYIRGDSLEARQLAEWEVENPNGGTHVRIVWDDDVEQAPAHASRYQQKTYTFPTGIIRVMEFKEENGGMLHEITSETAIFVLEGSGSVGSGREIVEIGEGDVVSWPNGTLRGEGDAKIIAWTMTGTANNGAAKSAVVRAEDATVSNSAQWDDEDGNRVRAFTPEQLANAPEDAIRLTVTRYTFDGNSVRVANSYQGGPTTPTSGDMDAIIYVTSGKLRFYQDGEMVEVGPGDAIRELAGSTHYWYRIEDSTFVATSSLPVVPLKK